MRITINGTEREYPTELTLSQLLDELKLEPIRVAVEVNKELVTRAEFPSTTVRDGDSLEIVTLVGGG